MNTFLNKIAELLKMTEEQKRQFISDYGLSINVLFIQASDIPKDQLAKLANQYKDPSVLAQQIYATVIDKNKFNEKLGQSVIEYHTQLFKAFAKHTDKTQQEQLHSYLQGLA